MLSVKRLASYYLNYPAEFSLLPDVFGYPAPPRTLSLRDRLEVLEDFADQRKALIQAWIGEWKDNGQRFGLDPEEGQTTKNHFKNNAQYAFRRIAAGLMALKDKDHFGEVYDPAPPADLPERAEEWIVDEFEVVGFMGSTEEWWKKEDDKPGGSHDMVLKEIVSLLYIFKDDGGLLTDDACHALIDKGFEKTALLTEAFGKHLTYTIPVPWWAHVLYAALIAGGALGFAAAVGLVGAVASVASIAGGAWIAAIVNGLTYPETENHVLMAYTSIHLARQWVRENPRGDSRLEEGDYASIGDDALDDDIEDLLMQAAGRFLHSGFFEANGRPYWAFSVHPLLNIQSYSEKGKIRTASANALDYACANGAFRSWNGRAYGPFRRNNKVADDVAIYGTASIMMAAMLGEPPWDGSYWQDHMGNPAGFSLWYKLSGYRPHEVITDFARKKKLFEEGNGYWARIQGRYTKDHYRKGKRPGYFESDGSVFRAADSIRSTPEFCFVREEFMNAGGGRFDRYKVTQDGAVSAIRNSPKDTHEYDFIARPQVAFFQKGYLDFEADPTVIEGEKDDERRARHIRERKDDMRKKIMFMFGHRDFWLSDNSGIYKGFSYGYFKHRDRDDRHSDFPMNIPPGWAERRLEIDGKHVLRNSSGSRAVFTFYDLGEGGQSGPYVVTGRVSKSKNRRKYRAYARGFWELVPSGRFDSVTELKDWVLEHNPDSQYSNSTEGEGRFYLYTMTSGETLQLNDLLGHGWKRGKWDDPANPIRKIWGPGADPKSDDPLRLADLTVNHPSGSDVKSMPLLEVREVDSESLFSGRLFASAAGDGRLRVSNPFLNWELSIDSSDYRNPARGGNIPGE